MRLPCEISGAFNCVEGFAVQIVAVEISHSASLHSKWRSFVKKGREGIGGFAADPLSQALNKKDVISTEGRNLSPATIWTAKPSTQLNAPFFTVHDKNTTVHDIFVKYAFFYFKFALKFLIYF